MNDSTPESHPPGRSAESDFSIAQDPSPAVTTDKTISQDTESSGAAVRQLLSNYDIGQKLRQLRLRKKIALVDLGKHTALSASMLSQLENGKLVPTLATLARISMVFDVGLDHFFGARRGQKTFALVRGAERLRFPDRADSPQPSYFFEC